MNQSPSLCATFCAALCAALLFSGCASSPVDFEPHPEVAPPAVDQPAPAPEADAEAAAEEDPRTVVISDESAEETSRRTLLEASREERERRQESEAPKIVITDKNLAEHATGELTIVGGNVSQATRESSRGASRGEAASGSSATPAGEDEESFWRNRVRQARQDWKTTTEEIEHLEGRVADLRRRFYEEDDPYYRDTQIKPSWDRSLERLAEARDAAEVFRLRVQEVLDEGRQAGALPGWLREGIELEPEARDSASRDDVEEHEAQEPSVVEPREPGTT